MNLKFFSLINKKRRDGFLGFLQHLTCELITKQKRMILKRNLENKSLLETEIETQKNIIEILESINDQNPKMEELIKKQNELIEILNKKIEFFEFLSSYFIVMKELVILIPKRKIIKKEIETIIKELNEDGILIDK